MSTAARPSMFDLSVPDNAHREALAVQAHRAANAAQRAHWGSEATRYTGLYVWHLRPGMVAMHTAGLDPADVSGAVVTGAPQHDEGWRTEYVRVRGLDTGREYTLSRPYQGIVHVVAPVWMLSAEHFHATTLD